MQQLRERKRNRLQRFDYTKEGYYFVTVCTHNRVNWFVEIIAGQMRLNGNGEIIQQQWDWLSNQYP